MRAAAALQVIAVIGPIPFSAPEWKLVEQVITAHPVGLEKEELAARSGYTENGQFNNMLGRLRSFGIVTARGPVAGTNLLFPERLT